MSGTTTNYALRKPTSTDPVDVAGDVGRLADDTDAALMKVGRTGEYTSATACPNTTATALVLSAVSDPNGWLSAGQVVPNLPGTYLVVASISIPGPPGTGRFQASLTRNGAAVGSSNGVVDAAEGTPVRNVVRVVTLNGASDAIGAGVQQWLGATVTPSVTLTVTRIG